MDRADFSSSKTARPVAGSRSAYRAWQMGNGTAGAVLFYAGQCPDPNCRRVEVIGSRVKLVWSGCGGGPAFFYSGKGLGAGPIFLCPDHECRKRALTVPRRTGTKKGRSLAETPNTIILSHPKFNVNYPAVKRVEFSLLYHLNGSYLWEIPSCKKACPVVD